MSLPNYQECMEPILELLSDGKTHTNSEAIQHVVKHFKLSAEEQSELIPSGSRPKIDDRVLWALLYLRRGEYVNHVSRGTFELTSAGSELLKKRKTGIFAPLTLKLLRSDSKALDTWYREKGLGKHSTSKHLSRPVSTDSLEDENAGETPRERLAKAYEDFKEKTVSDLVDKMKELDHKYFEIFIADLLPRIGYGRDANDVLRAHGGPGDGGIDGIVQLDTLGAQRIYIQAKHWKKPVDLSPLTQFYEKVLKSDVKAGVFVALTGFDGNATKYIRSHSENIAWVDAYDLAEVMLAKGVGLIEDTVYRTYRVDDDYFDQSSE